MSIAQIIRSAERLEEAQLVALAEAVEANRSGQREEIEAIRRSVRLAVATDRRLAERYGHVQRAMTGLDIVREHWPHAEACEALGDALLAILAPPSICRDELAVLEWPWVSVCGPLPIAS